MNLEKITDIDQSKVSLLFLQSRIIREDYRGLQLSQHNRYTFDQVKEMLKVLYDMFGEKMLIIRTADLKKRPENLKEEIDYANYVNVINKKFGKGTQDSIRKNLFVDFHRMGLITRFNKDKIELNSQVKGSVKFVKISKDGISLVMEKDYLKQYLIFTKAINKMLLGYGDHFYDIMLETQTLSVEEYAFFVSFLNKEHNNNIVTKEYIIELIRDYRSLSRYQKEQLLQTVKNICDPVNYGGDKKSKRDFHNWINEAQQVFTVLSMTAYYDYSSGKEKTLHFRIDKNGLFDNLSKLRRSLVEKRKYFEMHDIQKTIGFELHHIVPLSWARSKEEFYLLDKWDNMIYIDGYTHSIITQNNSKNVLLNILNTKDVELKDLENKVLLCIYEKNVKYDPLKKNIMLSKNVEILNSNDQLFE
jgi:hypothetical protein